VGKSSYTENSEIVLQKTFSLYVYSGLVNLQTCSSRMAAPGAPNVKYAQRNDSIYVTIELADVSNEKIELTEEKLSFKGTSSGREYAMDVKLFKKVDPKESITKVLPRNIQIFIKKAESEDEYWPRMLDDKAFEKKHFKIDWDRWKDEDGDSPILPSWNREN